MSTRTRAADYAQERRDHEAEARKALDERLLLAKTFRPEYGARGDFNLTTKTLLAALFFLNPDATIADVPKLNASTVEYNQQRRANETSIRDQLESIVPRKFFTLEIMSRGGYNNTTKVMLAAGHCVEEKLREQEDTESTKSTLRDLHQIILPKHPSAIALGDKTVRVTYSPTHNQDASVPELKRAGFLPEHLVTDEPTQPTHPIAYLEDTRKSTLRHSKTFHPAMSPTTRSSSNAKPHTLLPLLDISPKYLPSSNDTVSDSSLSDENDLFVNLRADELDQEMNLDGKPPTLPKRAFQNQGHWEIKARDMSSTPHSSVYVRELEQAAHRLVAKAKELVIAHNGDDIACQKSLMEAQDWCVDTIAMISGEIDKKKYRKKWTPRKQKWEAENKTDSNSSE